MFIYMFIYIYIMAYWTYCTPTAIGNTEHVHLIFLRKNFKVRMLITPECGASALSQLRYQLYNYFILGYLVKSFFEIYYIG